jgi:hypothetical protein
MQRPELSVQSVHFLLSRNFNVGLSIFCNGFNHKPITFFKGLLYNTQNVILSLIISCSFMDQKYWKI